MFWRGYVKVHDNLDAASGGRAAGLDPGHVSQLLAEGRRPRIDPPKAAAIESVVFFELFASRLLFCSSRT
ncbi:hypothetical protein Aduo_003406 [Ancylostoma duodenale]